MRAIFFGVFAVCILVASQTSFGHGDNTHHKSAKSAKEEEKAEQDEINWDKAILSQIDSAYQGKVRPIFKTTCFDCHTTKNSLPWYHAIPIVKQIIDKDIKEGRNHLEMSNGYPFGGHGDPLSDLEEIKKALNENAMPPLKYKIINWKAFLSKEEKNTIIQWASESETLLKNQPNFKTSKKGHQ